MTGRRRSFVSPPFNALQTTAVLVLLATLLAFTAPFVGGLPASDIDDVRVASLSAGDVGTIAATSSSSAAGAKASSGDAAGRGGKTTSSKRKEETSLLQQQVSSENVIRPLENIADRFLKSETVGVVDSIASQAIEAFARFVDGAGLVMVDIIDSLPGTIDRVADTVDGMVRTADDIGRNVAVIVTAPARIVLTSLNPDFNSTLTRRRAPDFTNNEVDSDSSSIRKNGTDKSLDNRTSSRRSSRRRQQSLLSNMFNQRRQSSNDRNLPLLNLFNRNNTSGRNFQQLLSRSIEDFHSGSNVMRARTLGRSRSNNRNDNGDTSDSDILSARGLGRSLLRTSLMSGLDQESGNRPNRPLNFLGFGALGSAFALNNRSRSRGDSSEEREKTVFEKNFEASKTQASIDKLEEEFGGFLGRLLGTIYRNADHIDESFSGGLRRVLGTPPLGENDRRNRFRGLGRSPSSAGVGSSSGGGSDVTTTSTPPPVKFRLTFDDIDPAPARNTAVSLP